VKTNAQNTAMHARRKHARRIFRENERDRPVKAFFKILFEMALHDRGRCFVGYFYRKIENMKKFYFHAAKRVVMQK
jgi:hypothetical protein